MPPDDDIDQWLQAQPLDEPVQIDGESVWLNVSADGAELGTLLAASFSQAQLEEALKRGFRSATEYEAGLGVSSGGKDLVLTQWLPGIADWTGAGEALENLLNQAAALRTVLGPLNVQPLDSNTSRNEQRLRAMLMGAKR